MKKIIAVLMTLAMILSLGAVMASALTVEEIEAERGYGFAPGAFSGPAEDFSALGTVKIDWDPEASTKLNVTDGNMADWADAGYNTIGMTANNMVNWGGLTNVPEGWSISTYFVADSDYLYIGFYVTDPAFAYGDGTGYNGDAFQVCIDFGGKMGKQLQLDPDVLTNPKNIFYSFSCAEDGAPLMIMRQESDQDGFLTEEDGVKGAASKTTEGWCAEFALSFERLFEDYAWKAWDDDAKIYVGSDEKLPLNIGCCLYYLDRSVTAGDINWAAGSTNGVCYENGAPGVSWTAWDNGINLELDYAEGMEFTCENIVVIPLTETTPEEVEETEETTEEATTEAVEDTTVAATEEATTEAATEATTDAATEAATAEETTVEEKSGCGAVVGFGAVAVLAAAAAAVALKKKD
ncbi:MAG: hypothetical protein IKU90_00235 [Clostridia bacterium]|nr:hypothetical protein [Clostridia bacterium]